MEPTDTSGQTPDLPLVAYGLGAAGLMTLRSFCPRHRDHALYFSLEGSQEVVLHTSHSALARMQTAGSNLHPLVITSVSAPCLPAE